MTDCNCVANHHLCDVSLTDTLPIADINFLRDSWMAARIAECLRIEPPFTQDELLLFFEMQTLLYDLLAAQGVPRRDTFADGRKNPRVAKAKVTTEVRAFIAMHVVKGTATREIRSLVSERFGVDISSQYMSMLRRRVVKQ